MKSDDEIRGTPFMARIDADAWGMLELDKSDTELIYDFAARLDSIFAKYGCDPDEAGWRELALHLSLKYEPAFRLKASDKKKIPNLAELLSISRLLDRDENLTERDAAERVAQESGKNANTLRVRYSEAKNSDAKELNQAQLYFTLEKAADVLQNSDRIPTNYKELLCKKLRLKPRTKLVPECK